MDRKHESETMQQRGYRVGYEFYWLDDIMGYQLLRILPERRKSRERITWESILKLGRKALGPRIDRERICVVPVTLKKEARKPHPDSHRKGNAWGDLDDGGSLSYFRGHIKSKKEGKTLEEYFGYDDAHE